MDTLSIIVIIITILSILFFIIKYITSSSEVLTVSKGNVNWNTIIITGDTTLDNIEKFTNYVIYPESEPTGSALSEIIIRLDITGESLKSQIRNNAVMFTVANPRTYATFITRDATFSVRYIVPTDFIYTEPFPRHVGTWQQYYFPRNQNPQSLPDGKQIRGIGSLFVSY